MLDDSWFDDLNPILRQIMYEHWSRDEELQYEMLKSQAILIGSFSNPLAAKAMVNSDSSKFESSDEDFEKSIQMVEEDKKKHLPKRKRQRKVQRKMTNG